MIQSWIDAVRRNHGLEHATVAVLIGRHGARRLAGRASSDGFFILGGVDEAELRSCAEEALTRMQHGEPELAVSPLCGTNIAVTGLVTAAAAVAAVSVHGSSRPLRERFPNAVTAAMFGVIAAQPLGRLLQRYVTTRGDVDDIEITGARSFAGGLKKIYTRVRA
jgi:hypothetical protein